MPGGGLEPNEDSFEAASREVMEEAGVRGVLSRPLGQFENLERKHRTSVYVLIVTEELEEWDDSKSIGRKRKWFSIDEALDLLVSLSMIHVSFTLIINYCLVYLLLLFQAVHKPVQVQYVKLLRNRKN